MCNYFLFFRSCCGMPVRLGLVFIALLSILTGAMINGFLRKAGVDISNIEGVFVDKKNVTNNDTNSDRPDMPDDVIMPDDNETGNVIVLLPVPTETTTTTTEPTTDDETHESTVEILGDGTTAEYEDYEDEAMTESDTFHVWRTGPNYVTMDEITTLEPTTTTSSYFMRKVASANRHGINFMSIAFIGLGILLLFANFTNNSELGLVYVLLSLVNCIVSLCLLTSTLSECSQHKDRCLLSKLDALTGFMLTLFWFIYIFVWVCFAGVANAFANGLTDHVIVSPPSTS